jgi:hypothetical protein
MSDDSDSLGPAFYAARSGQTRRASADWWLLLHPPYTLWHLSYAVIGACISPAFDGWRLAATVFAFFLAVGVGAHALDELHDRPLGTGIPRWQLVAAAGTGLAGAISIGAVGLTRVGPGLTVFIVVGVVLSVGYNLELFNGRLHNDFTFAAAWGAFPVLTAYYAQAETLRVPAIAAAVAAYWLSMAQRRLSTPARMLRRQVASVDGTISYNAGGTECLSVQHLLAPLEAALIAAAYGVIALAAALLLYRGIDG